MPLLLGLATGGSTWEVGAGYRDIGAEFDAGSAGIEAFGRRRLTDAWALEVGGYVAALASGPTPLAEAVVASKYEENPDTPFHVPISSERGAVHATLDWGFGPRAHAKAVTGGLHALAGIEGRFVLDRYAKVDPDYPDGGDDVVCFVRDDAAHLAIGPSLGFALDAWIGRRLGVRWTGIDRFAVEPQPDYHDLYPDGTPVPLEPVLTGSLAWSLDVVVAL